MSERIKIFTEARGGATKCLIGISDICYISVRLQGKNKNTVAKTKNTKAQRDFNNCIENQ